MVKSEQTVTIGHLYPKQMNVYGDMGNIITLKYRLKERGITTIYKLLNSTDELGNQPVDILLGGGGQNSNQGLIQADLLKYSSELKARCEDGLVALLICGMYQMFGNRFVLPDKSQIKGAGILDLETIAGEQRLIGNIVTKSDWGDLIGFENHSGKTYLGSNLKPLGVVVKGAGNNGESKDEGAIYKNIFGSYLHGPVLVKNPRLADELILRALNKKYGTDTLVPLDDTLEITTAKYAAKRPR